MLAFVETDAETKFVSSVLLSSEFEFWSVGSLFVSLSICCALLSFSFIESSKSFVEFWTFCQSLCFAKVMLWLSLLHLMKEF